MRTRARRTTDDTGRDGAADEALSAACRLLESTSRGYVPARPGRAETDRAKPRR
jgi:hypothetical protein